MTQKANCIKYFVIKPDIQKVSILVLLMFSTIILYLFIKQENDISFLKSKPFEQNSIVHNLKNQVSDLEDEKSDLENQVNDLDDRIDGLESRVNDLEGRIDDLDSR